MLMVTRYTRQKHKADLVLNRELHMTIDKRLIAEQNQLAILMNLHRFGWLTSRMLAALVWPNASQPIVLARRTLKKMTDAKLVLKRALPEGGDCFVLSASGARLLNAHEGINAKGGAGLALGNPVHRSCANWYLIRRWLAGDRIWTEYEIQSGRSPVCAVSGKVADGLVETEFGLIWVEVENAWKNRLERAKVVNFARRTLLNGDSMAELAPDYYLFRIAIVGTTQDSLRAISRSFTDAYQTGDVIESQLASVEISLLPVDKSLIAGECITGNLWYDVIQRQES